LFFVDPIFQSRNLAQLEEDSPQRQPRSASFGDCSCLIQCFPGFVYAIQIYQGLPFDSE